MLAGLPPSTRTDLAVDILHGTQVEDHDDHLLVRTPDNPGYHWGNFVQVTTGDPDDVPRWLARFAESFPGARHRAFGLPRPPSERAWAGSGLRRDDVEALTSREAPRPTPIPDGYDVTPLTTDLDWGSRLVAEIAENDASGSHARAPYRDFATRQMAARRQAVRSGAARWFGTWGPDGELAASLGIVILTDLEPVTARYQSVLTSRRHRRRGLARYLLSVAAAWATDEGAEELVIVADAGSAAGRLYARAGFAPGPVAYGLHGSA